MATFWTGAALAADYGQQNLVAARRAARAAQGAAWSDQLRKKHQLAVFDVNLAIRTAVLAQLDEQLADLCDSAGLEDDDMALHGGCHECYQYARLAVPSVNG